MSCATKTFYRDAYWAVKQHVRICNRGHMDAKRSYIYKCDECVGFHVSTKGNKKWGVSTLKLYLSDGEIAKYLAKLDAAPPPTDVRYLRNEVRTNV